MNLIRRGATIFLAFLALTQSANAKSVDWKLYGGTSGKMADQYCFYEERSVMRPKPGFVHYWSKCLLASDLNSVDEKKHYFRAMVDMSASRIVHHYMLPMLKTENLSPQEIVGYIGLEALADVADDLEVQSLSFAELDCRGRRLQILSFEYKGQNTKNLGWSDIPPEGNGATILALLCE